jgi:hypothetical protein
MPPLYPKAVVSCQDQARHHRDQEHDQDQAYDVEDGA